MPLFRHHALLLAQEELVEGPLVGPSYRVRPADGDGLSDQAQHWVAVFDLLREGEGLVTLQAHRGAVVAAPSLSQINELYDLRAMLEKDLIVRAIPNSRPEDADRAEQVLAQLDEAFAGEVIHAWGVLNFEFHRYKAKHAFANEEANERKLPPLEYNPQAAEQAWKRTMEFLDRHLKKSG